MTAMRNLNPIASKAAILPKHRLAFNVPGTALVEPSWASVEPVTIDNDPDMSDSTHSVVHGVLYKLSEEDFNAVCQSEGVPFAYRLHRCRVVPYLGDGNHAGRSALDSQMQMAAMDIEDIGERCIDVPAFTLRAGRKTWRDAPTDIPPSQSYLNVLIRGAKEFKLDRDYIEKLEAYPAGRTVVGDGIAEGMLNFAEFSKMLRRS